MNYYLDVLKKYAVFDGRARRKEYWMYFLFNVIIVIVLGILDQVLGTTSKSGQGLLGGIYGLATLIPGIAVGIRRLHDTNHSGWWLLCPCVPIIFMFQDGTPGENEYGPNPKEVGM